MKNKYFDLIQIIRIDYAKIIAGKIALDDAIDQFFSVFFMLFLCLIHFMHRTQFLQSPIIPLELRSLISHKDVDVFMMKCFLWFFCCCHLRAHLFSPIPILVRFKLAVLVYPMSSTLTLCWLIAMKISQFHHYSLQIQTNRLMCFHPTFFLIFHFSYGTEHNWIIWNFRNLRPVKMVRKRRNKHISSWENILLLLPDKRKEK